MRHVDEVDAERSKFQARAGRRHVHGNFRRAGLGRAPGFEQGGGKRRGVDGNVEFRPQVDQRAHMIFVGMRQHQADEVLPLFDEIADVRQDKIDAR